MADTTTDQTTFSLAQARHIVKDLFAHNPVIYWADFLFSAIGGMVTFTLVRRVLPPYSLTQAAVFILCGLLYYRAVLFTHEMVHMPARGFRVFRIVWNALIGIPFLMPSFTYYTHTEHHLRKHFATKQDGEYLPLATTSPWQIAIYLCQPLVLPGLAVVRFMVFTPLSWLSPRFRAFTLRHASAMVMDPSYIRPLPTEQTLRIFRLQEALCFAWTVGVAIAMATGVVPLAFLPTIYLLAVMVLYLNSLRTLGAHRYTNTGGEVTFLDQLLDSVNYPRHPFLSSLWAPVGLRFHALHHLFPSLPYHNLARAHARLMQQLPADSPYRLTESPSLRASLVQLWRASRTAGTGSAAVPKPAMSGISQRMPQAH